MRYKIPVIVISFLCCYHHAFNQQNIVGIGYSQSKIRLYDANGPDYYLESSPWLNGLNAYVNYERLNEHVFLRAQLHYSRVNFNMQAGHYTGTYESGPNYSYYSSSSSKQLNYDVDINMVGLSFQAGRCMGQKKIRFLLGAGLTIISTVYYKLNEAEIINRYSVSSFSQTSGPYSSQGVSSDYGFDAVDIYKKPRIWVPVFTGMRYHFSDSFMLDVFAQAQSHFFSPLARGYTVYDQCDFSLGLTFNYVLKNRKASPVEDVKSGF